jgi:outer membrane receptor protein involved in Fe transport
MTPGYGILDLAAGIGHASWSTELYVKNAFDQRGEQARFTVCGVPTCPLAVIPIEPRIFGISFGQRF